MMPYSVIKCLISGDRTPLNFAALSLRGVAPRNYRKIPKSSHIKDLQDKEAA